MKHKVHCHYGVASSRHHGGLGPTDRRAAAEPHSAHTDTFSTCSKAGEDLAKYKGHCFPHFQPALEIKRETVLADRFVPRGKKKSRFHQVEFRLSYFSPRHFWVPSAVPPTRAAAPRLQSFPSAPLGHPGPSRVTLSAAEPRCCPGHRIVLTLFKVNTKGDSEAGV